jgi:hypothetical protein
MVLRCHRSARLTLWTPAGVVSEGDLAKCAKPTWTSCCAIGYQVAGSGGGGSVGYVPRPCRTPLICGHRHEADEHLPRRSEEVIDGAGVTCHRMPGGATQPANSIDPTPAVRALATRAIRLLLDTADRRYASGELGLRYLPAWCLAPVSLWLFRASSRVRIGTVSGTRFRTVRSSRAHVGTFSLKTGHLRARTSRLPSVRKPSVMVRCGLQQPMSNGAPAKLLLAVCKAVRGSSSALQTGPP